MRAGYLFAAALALGFVAGAVPARAHQTVASPLTSPLALPIRSLESAGDDRLAQRVIDREWGASDDSTYRVVEVPGWKSEGLGLALSGALPGTGQLYAGESSGWLYLLTESAGWVGRTLARRHADQRFDELSRYVGDPTDPAAGFSFSRFESQTGRTASDLRSLWSGDRVEYYRALASDPAYAAGFSGATPADGYGHYSDLLATHDKDLQRATLLEGALMLNHVVSALDALRMVRLKNLPLREQYHLEFGERWRRGHPELRAAVVRRF